MRSLSVAIALVSTVGCQELWHLEKVGVAPDAAPDAPAPDAPPDGPTPMCPASYNVLGAGSYRVSVTAVQWREAAAECAADETASGPILLHTHLAVISDTAERDLLYGKGNDLFVGLTDFKTQGTFAWVTHEPSPMDPAGSDTSLWTTGEPNNIGIEHCAHFDSQHTGRINNIDCTSAGATPHPYVCECDTYANDTATYP